MCVRIYIYIYTYVHMYVHNDTTNNDTKHITTVKQHHSYHYQEPEELLHDDGCDVHALAL